MLCGRYIGIDNVEPKLFDFDFLSTKEFRVFWVLFNAATDVLSKANCRMTRVSRQRIWFLSLLNTHIVPLFGVSDPY